MCGIAGIMTIDGASPESSVLDRLSELLAHRGPDGNGQHLSGDVGMVQTRLAIIDLETGDQPIYVSDSGQSAKAALIANGEIYNYIELRRELEQTSCEGARLAGPGFIVCRQSRPCNTLCVRLRKLFQNRAILFLSKSIYVLWDWGVPGRIRVRCGIKLIGKL